MYGMEATPIKKVNEKRMNVADMKMLRWMSGVTRRDRISNTRIRGTVNVAELSKKVQEARLRWYVWSRTEKRRGSCGEKDDGHGGAWT